MLTYKLSFYDTLMQYLQIKVWMRVIVIGDLNICHTAIDIARPKENVNSIWFLPIERAKMSEFFASGYVDAFRHLYPDATDQYTRRSYRAWAKANNVWRRIDYACVSRAYIWDIVSFTHHPEISGSDHCPIEIVVK
jgi:exodeoxyribonuclease-3